MFNSSRLMEWRNICLFVFKIIATTCVYGIIAISQAFGEWSYIPSPFINGLHLIYMALMVLAVLSVVVPMIPWVKHRLEYSLYGLLILESVCIAMFVTYEKGVAYSSRLSAFNRHIWSETEQVENSAGAELCTRSPRITVFILSMELIMDAWVQFFMYFFIITVSIVLPSRVRIAAWVQLGVLLIYCIPTFTGQAYCKILLYPE